MGITLGGGTAEQYRRGSIKAGGWYCRDLACKATSLLRTERPSTPRSCIAIVTGIDRLYVWGTSLLEGLFGVTVSLLMQHHVHVPALS